MSHIESDTDNEGEFIKLPESFQDYNTKPPKASMNIATSSEEESNKADTSEDDAVSGNEMASCDVASHQDKMAPQNVAEANGAISEQSPREVVDSLAKRKAAVDAHNMASKNVANNGAELFKWNMETTDDKVVAPPTASTGDGAEAPANIHGDAVPPQDGAAANSAMAVQVATNDMNKVAGVAEPKMAVVNIGGSATEATVHGGAVPSLNGVALPRVTVLKVANYFDHMVEQTRARLVNGGGAAMQATGHGGGVPSGNGEAARHAPTMQGSNYLNQVAARAAYMEGINVGGVPSDNGEAARYEREVNFAHYCMMKMVDHVRRKREAKNACRAAIQAAVHSGGVPPQNAAAARSATLVNVAGYGNKTTGPAGDKMATGAGKKSSPAPAALLAPRRSNIGGCFEVRVGAQRVRWINEGTVVFTTHRRSGECAHVTARRVAVRPPLWRVTIQALLLMTLAIFLTYFVIYFTDRYLEEDN